MSIVHPQDWAGKTALITGASSGIGAATAQRLARAGLRVILVARRRERLEVVAEKIQAEGGTVHLIAADLTSASARQAVFEQVFSEFSGTDILINNAGFGWYGFGDEMPWSTALEMVEINIAAVVHFTLLFLNKMRESNIGHIINIGSISGELPSQGIAVYGATKSFLNNFTIALYRELKGTRLHISVVRAGPVRTEFCHTAAEKPGGFHLPTEKIGVTPEEVAERIWELIQRPRRAIYVPAWLAVTPWVESYFGWLIDRLGPLLLNRS
jgi:short-subunit dehydrogenase